MTYFRTSTLALLVAASLLAGCNKKKAGTALSTPPPSDPGYHATGTINLTGYPQINVSSDYPDDCLVEPAIGSIPDTLSVLIGDAATGIIGGDPADRGFNLRLAYRGSGNYVIRGDETSDPALYGGFQDDYGYVSLYDGNNHSFRTSTGPSGVISSDDSTCDIALTVTGTQLSGIISPCFREMDLPSGYTGLWRYDWVILGGFGSFQITNSHVGVLAQFSCRILDVRP